MEVVEVSEVFLVDLQHLEVADQEASHLIKIVEDIEDEAEVEPLVWDEELQHPGHKANKSHKREETRLLPLNLNFLLRQLKEHQAIL